MKTVFFLLTLAFFSVTSYAQDCEDVDLKTDSALRKAEPCVTAATNFVLSKPISFKGTQILEYRLLIVNWMDKTSDFTFSLNPMMLEICMEKVNSDLMGIYMSCLAKCAIEFRTDYTERAVVMFVEYLVNEKNEVKKTSKIKKLVKAKDENKLAQYL